MGCCLDNERRRRVPPRRIQEGQSSGRATVHHEQAVLEGGLRSRQSNPRRCHRVCRRWWGGESKRTAVISGSDSAGRPAVAVSARISKAKTEYRARRQQLGISDPTTCIPPGGAESLIRTLVYASAGEPNPAAEASLLASARESKGPLRGNGGVEGTALVRGT